MIIVVDQAQLGSLLLWGSAGLLAGVLFMFVIISILRNV